MSDVDVIIRCLEAMPSGRCCDGCLARKTGIRDRGRVGRVCRELADEGVLTRKKGKCPLGDHSRTLNGLQHAAGRSPRRRRSSAGPRRALAGAAPEPAGLSIEEAWRFVDRFCRALWSRHFEDEVPQSLADLIISLRDEEVVPAHEANMMHTIRSLRNFVVHENLDFGEHETTIARAAWAIVRDWARQHEAEAWRLAENVCGARAA